LKEIPIDYRDRPEGSSSKLNTYKDGIRVLKTIVLLFKDFRPLLFFSSLSLVSLIVGISVGIPVITEFVRTSFITKLPSAVLASALILVSILLLTSGFILDTLVKQNKQNYELFLNMFTIKNKVDNNRNE
jgi:hypothetical protein